MKPWLILSLSLVLVAPATFCQTWEDPTMLGILEEALAYVDAGGENNLDQNGVQAYFTGKFNKAEFDKAFRETAEFGWDTVIYHYLNALYFVAQTDSVAARQECYRAGSAFTGTSAANRNVLSRFGLTLDHITHLREYLFFGQHRNSKSIGFDGAGKVLKGYSGYAETSPGNVPAFPFPPPKPSTDCELPRSLLDPAKTFGEVDAKISNALTACGYDRKSYFSVPGGFALVTRIEQFNSDGTCKSGDDRWNVSLKPNAFDLSEYLRALFWGRVGKYRILVFLLTDQPFGDSGKPPTDTDGDVWLSNGVRFLPESLASKPLSKGHHCFTLVYEFELTETLTEPKFLKSATCTGKVHVEKSGIWNKIK